MSQFKIIFHGLKKDGSAYTSKGSWQNIKELMDAITWLMDMIDKGFHLTDYHIYFGYDRKEGEENGVSQKDD